MAARGNRHTSHLLRTAVERCFQGVVCRRPTEVLADKVELQRRLSKVLTRLLKQGVGVELR